jgi:hypothetical protein
MALWEVNQKKLYETEIDSQKWNGQKIKKGKRSRYNK